MAEADVRSAAGGLAALVAAPLKVGLVVLDLLAILQAAVLDVADGAAAAHRQP
jgi:hypothetical protein